MIEIKCIQKVYIPKKGKKVNAIDDVSLLFPEKGLIFISGKSGSGKSTLLNLLGGLDVYDKGEIIFKGKSTKDFTQSDFDNLRNSYIGFIFQEYNILDDFSVKDNIALAIKLQGKNPTEEEIISILEEVELTGLSERKPNELSGGQKQRVAIARALVKNPEIILADEPTGSLDSKTGIQILDTLKKLSKDKLVIVVSHDMEFAEKYGDRVIELSDGKIISDISKRINDNIINIKEEFKSIKSKLPLKDTIKIAIGSLKNKKIRLIITILLSVIAFGLFGIADNISSYNRKAALINTIIDENIPAVNFKAEDLSRDRWYRYMSDEDIKILNEELDMNFKPVYNGMSYERGTQSNLEIDNVLDINKLDRNINTTIVLGVCELEEEELQTLGYEFVGNLPSSYSEIAITRYLFDNFKKGGYSYSDENGEIVLQPEEINDVEDIIGKKICIVNSDSIISGTYTITAVINTHFDENKYQPVNPEIPYTLEFQANISSGYHALGFVAPGFINHFINMTDIYGLNLFGTVELDYYFNDKTLRVRNILKKSDISQDNIYYFEENKSSLSENEVLINAESFLEFMKTELNPEDITEDLINFYPKDFGGFFFDHIYMNFIKREAVRPYAEEHYQEAIENGFTYYDSNVGDSEEKKIDKFISYLTSSGYVNNIFTNKCGYDLSIDEITIAIEKYIPQYENTQITTEFKKYTNNQESLQGSKNIVGIYISNKKMYDIYRGYTWVVLDDQNYSAFSFLFDHNPYKWVIAPMPKNRTKVTEIVEYYYENIEKTEFYILNNAAESLISSADVNLREISASFIPVGIGFALFSCVMLSNFIATSISYKKREIGILRALGARSKDVFSIFFIESLIISLVNSFLSIILTYISIMYINDFIRADLGFIITVLHFSVRQIILISLMSIIVAFISSFVPVYRTAKKKPIDAIVNH